MIQKLHSILIAHFAIDVTFRFHVSMVIFPFACKVSKLHWLTQALLHKMKVN